MTGSIFAKIGGALHSLASVASGTLAELPVDAQSKSNLQDSVQSVHDAAEALLSELPAIGQAILDPADAEAILIKAFAPKLVELAEAIVARELAKHGIYLNAPK